MCHIQIQNECCAQNIIKFFHSHLNNQADKKIYVAYVTGGSHKKKGEIPWKWKNLSVMVRTCLHLCANVKVLRSCSYAAVCVFLNQHFINLSKPKTDIMFHQL